jgi:hypothetical protein
MEKLHALLDAIESTLPHAEQINATISKSNVGWHLQHVLLTFRGIPHNLQISDASTYSPKFSIRKILIFTIGKIPRGKAKAPPAATPDGTLSLDKLKAQIKTARENINQLSNLPANNYFAHPFFGHLNVKDAKRFLIIHTQHHLAIVNDILKAESKK